MEWKKVTEDAKKNGLPYNFKHRAPMTGKNNRFTTYVVSLKKDGSIRTKGKPESKRGEESYKRLAYTE